MNIHTLTQPATPELEAALEEFERQFWYPLGGHARFRISHCGHYGRFFRAMGEAACFVAEREGTVLGVLGTAVRRLILPSGAERKVGYIGDLKIAPGARGGLVLARLAREAFAWLSARVDAAVGIAMDGTPVIPTSYTGRAGVPKFEQAGSVTILRMPAGGTAPGCLASPARVAEAYARLSAGRYAFPVEDSGTRSEMDAVALLNRGACGLLEDTRRAKKLFAETGQELLSAHLSAFAYSELDAAKELIAAARSVAAERGFDAVFLCADERLASALAPAEPQVATATIFAANLGAGVWSVNTSEI